jgi:chemotaxis protein CheD
MPSGLYADEVMVKFMDALRLTQTMPRDYVVKIAGGGNMFPQQLAGGNCRACACNEGRYDSCATVGCKNIHAARTLLQAHGFHIAAENVGGEGSRQVILELWSGNVWVRRGAAMAGGSEAAA